jgi:hypothetical protein
MFRDLYGRRRVKRNELENPMAQPAMTGAAPMMPNMSQVSNPMATPVGMNLANMNPQMSAGQLQRPVFENQINQVARPDFSNILAMIQRRRRNFPPSV